MSFDFDFWCILINGGFFLKYKNRIFDISSFEDDSLFEKYWRRIYCPKRTFSKGENGAEVDVSGGALCLPFHREIFGLVQEVRGLFHDKRRNME